ncbi:MAG TPA: SDR family NAD(P)-dependent oxidoreductase, partial [Candidatus Limnocylindrales bacterium]
MPETRRSAIVTGGARGIGLAIGERLARDGYGVLLFDRDAGVSAAAAGIPGGIGMAGDVTDVVAMETAIRRAEDEIGPLAVLVNNAGIPSRANPIERQSDTDWERAIDIMLTAPFRWCRAVVPIMRGHGWGRIINMSSVAGKEGNPNNVPYSVAKAGLICLTKALAKEVALDGILVNAVAPAVIETDLLRDVDPKDLEPLLVKIPMGRMGQPGEVAA